MIDGDFESLTERKQKCFLFSVDFLICVAFGLIRVGRNTLLSVFTKILIGYNFSTFVTG